MYYSALFVPNMSRLKAWFKSIRRVVLEDKSSFLDE